MATRASLLIRSGVILALTGAVAPPAFAHPEFATNCSTCHGNAAKVDSTPKSGSTLSFGKVLVGDTKSVDIKINNTSTANKGGGFAGTMPAGTGPFARVGDGKLATTFGGFLLPAGVASTHAGGVSSATFSYNYAPTARGVNSLDLAFTPSSGFPAGKAPTINFTLSGQGVAPVVSIDALAGALGNVRIGAPAIAMVKVMNVGDGNLAGAGLGNLVGSVASGANGFVGNGGAFDLPDNGVKNFEFSFSPTSRGAAAADIVINTTNGSDDNKNNAQSLTAKLTANAVGPILGTSLAPDSTIDFGKVVAPTGAERSLSLSNNTTDLDLGGLTNLSILSAAITGADASMFSLKSFTPGTVLSKSQTQNLQLQFLPTAGAVGLANATLTIVTDENAALGQSGRSVSFSLVGLAANESYWKGAGGAWNASGNSMNWVVAAGSSVHSAALPNANTEVVFAANGQAAINTTLGQDFTIRSLSFAGGAPPTSIAGNTLTLRGGISVGEGKATHSISSQVQLAAAQNWNIGGGSTLMVSGGIGGSSDAALTKTGSGKLVLSGVNTYTGGTNVNDGALLVAHALALPAGRDLSLTGPNTTVSLAAGLDATVRLGALTFGGRGGPSLATFDLANNRLVLDGKSLSTDKLRGDIAAAFAGGAWTGRGLTSSTAAADAAAAAGKGPTAIGYASNADFGLGLKTFGDATVDANALLVRYTLLGDANLDAKVDLADFVMLRKSFGQSANASWSQGDFNYDGIVDLSDFFLLRSEFGLSLTLTPSGASIEAIVPAIDKNLLVIPEPSSAALLGIGGLVVAGSAVLFKRRSRNLNFKTPDDLRRRDWQVGRNA